MRITTPAVARVHVATRYRNDFILDETTFATIRDKQQVIPIYALRPTTATVLDYDFKAAARLSALARTTAIAGVAIGFTVAIPFIAAFFVGRDLVRSLLENVAEGSRSLVYVLATAADAIRSTASEIVNP